MAEYKSDKSCAEIDAILNKAVQRTVIIADNSATGINTFFSALNKRVSIYKNPIKTLNISIDTESLINEYGEATIIFRTPSDEEGSVNFTYKSGTVINWANGEKPVFYKGCMYEISITRLGIQPGINLAGSYFNVVAVPFTPVD